MNSRVAVEIMGYESVAAGFDSGVAVYCDPDDHGKHWRYRSESGQSLITRKSDFTPTTDLRHTSQSWCKLTGEQKADASVIGAEQSGEHRYGKIFDHWLENPDKWCEAMLAAKGGG